MSLASLPPLRKRPLAAALLAARVSLAGPVAASAQEAVDASPLRPLDDQVLSRQRGGHAGMVMVAAAPQFMQGGNAVTLWDEIAPPAPLPVPVDSGRAAQGNSKATS